MSLVPQKSAIRVNSAWLKSVQIASVLYACEILLRNLDLLFGILLLMCGQHVTARLCTISAISVFNASISQQAFLIYASMIVVVTQVS